MQASLLPSIRRRIDREDAFVVVTVTDGPDGVGEKVIVDQTGQVEGILSVPGWPSDIVPAASAALALNRTDSHAIATKANTYTLFLDVYVPPPRLIIVGAVQTAQSLTRLAKELGYRVIVTDARAAFATGDRFPEADSVLKGWPQDILPTFKMDESTYIVLLSHDPKFDEPTLHYVLGQPVRYIGAIGSRRTQEQRRERLRQQGFSQHEVARIHGPVGLDLGGEGAEEVALAILAEMIAVRYGRDGGFMTAPPV